MRRARLACGAAAAVAAAVVLAVEPPSRAPLAPIAVRPFSALPTGLAPPPGWREYRFRKAPRPTEYALVAESGTTVLRADSRAGGSLLYTFVDMDPADYPTFRWRWKVLDLPENTDLHVRRGDDAAARVYVAFRYTPKRIRGFERFRYNLAKVLTGHYPPYAAVCFLWSRDLPVGTVLRNPFVERSIQVVVRSGEADLGRWLVEEEQPARIFEDVMGFPPPPISHVALMTDTENTGTDATALFGDMEFLPGPTGSPPAPRERRAGRNTHTPPAGTRGALESTTRRRDGVPLWPGSGHGHGHRQPDGPSPCPRPSP